MASRRMGVPMRRKSSYAPSLAGSPITPEAVVEEMLPAISITSLNDPISIVHIPLTPVSDADAPCGSDNPFTEALFWTLERASNDSVEFFNVTSNRAEIAIFAGVELVADEWAAAAQQAGAGVRISGPWMVFEVGSGDVDDEFETGNYDSPHLRYVSAPLAKENISILYQSSYHADFLLVKEVDFERASAIFERQGWTVNPTSTPSPRQSMYTSPVSPLSPISPQSLPGNPSISALSTSLLTSTRPSRSTRVSPLSRPGSPGSRYAALPRTNPQSLQPSPSPSPAPFTPDITVLPAPLAVVGFHASSPNFTLHVAQIQKLVTWPARCLGVVNSEHGSGATGSAARGERPFISFTRTQDGASLATDVRAIRALFADTEGMLCGEEIGKAWESEAESDFDLDEEGDIEDEARGGEDDDDYNGEASYVPDVAIGRGLGLGVATRTALDDGEQLTPRACVQSPMCRNASSSDSHIPPASCREGYFPLSPPTTATHQQDRWEGMGHHRAHSDPAFAIGLGSGIEGQMGASGRRERSRRATEELPRSVSYGPGPERIRMRSTLRGGEKRKGRKRCLTLDLSGVRAGEEEGVFHLDKSGLVTRFSTLLQRANVRMLYSSTMHTSNILVEARDVVLARRVLAPSPTSPCIPRPLDG